MQLGIELRYLARINCPTELVVPLVHMALQAYETHGIDPLKIDFALDAVEGDQIGLDISRLANGIVDPIGRIVRIAVWRTNGETIMALFDPKNPVSTMDASTCAIQQGELVVLDDDVEKWRDLAGQC